MGMTLSIVLSLLLVCMQTEYAAAADKPDIYRLRQGDSVQVSVWREDALQKQVMVLPDGSVTLPLAGRVEVAGLSTPEVEQLVATKLKAYLPEPIVTVVIAGIDGNRAYVLGKVLHPGVLAISGPLTVLQAISMVGGFDKFADESGIKVIGIDENNADGMGRLGTDPTF